MNKNTLLKWKTVKGKVNVTAHHCFKRKNLYFVRFSVRQRTLLFVKYTNGTAYYYLISEQEKDH